MSSRLQQTTLGEQVTLEKIESAFRQFWRAAADDGSSEAVLKAGTLNLIIYTQQREKYLQVLEQINDVISHHPGRIIIVFVDEASDQEAIDARISAFFQEPRPRQKQITAEVISLETGRNGLQHLAGAVLPLLLPDLPVFFWCTFSCVLIHPHLKPLFRYTDRLIVTTEPEYQSKQQFAQALDTILDLKETCSLSDLNWSKLTPWREALAQFFDQEKSRAYLHTLNEVEIIYSGEHLSSHALLLAGCLSSALKNISAGPANMDDSTIFFRRRAENVAIKIRRKKIDGISGLYKVKLIAEEKEKAVILTVTAMPDGSLHTSSQIGGAILPTNTIRTLAGNDAQMLCTELDFVQQDMVYLKACENIAEYLHEN